MDTLTDESIPNLLINGGFEEETPNGFDPVLWSFRGARGTSSIVLSSEDSCPNNLSALSAGEEKTNFWTRVTQPQRYPGYKTFVRLVVNSAETAITSFYDLFAARLSSTIARDTPPLPEFYDYTATGAPYSFPFFNQYRGVGTSITTEKDVSGIDLDNREVTLAFSFFVESGEGTLEAFFEMQDESVGDSYEFGPDPDNPTDGKIVVASALPTSSWMRVGKVFRLPAADGVRTFPSGPAIVADDPLTGFGIRANRTSDSGAFIVYITATALVHGNYSSPGSIPYNGDLSYLLDPPGTVRPSFGPLCPPGYRPFSDVVGTDFIGRFPVTSAIDPDPLQLGGEETHTHDLIGWGGTKYKKRKPGSDDAGARTGNHDDEHEVTAALNAPPSRSSFLCIKL